MDIIALRIQKVQSAVKYLVVIKFKFHLFIEVEF